MFGMVANWGGQYIVQLQWFQGQQVGRRSSNDVSVEAVTRGAFCRMDFLCR